MLKNITEYEIPLLPETFNFTDGHVFRDWTAEESSIIGRAADFLRFANRQMQFQLEEAYVSAFMSLFHQTLDARQSKFLICTTASMALEIVANYLRMAGRRLALIEPCFDNLADIFKRHGVSLTALPDKCLGSSDFCTVLSTLEDVGAICIVTPNNPTGAMLTEENMVALIDFCKRTGCIMILDCCFRAYAPSSANFDMYGMLAGSGTKYFVIEDTGKTWPTAELKAPILTVSTSLFQDTYDIYTDMLLHTSPFVLKLMTEFLEHSRREQMATTHGVVSTNRSLLYQHVRGTLLSPVEKPFMSVSWLKVDGLTGIDVKRTLDNVGVHVLPGDFFYWSDHLRGSRFLRIALAREPKIFARGASIIGQVCRELSS